MSIFGALDAATIKTNPYFVEKGEYTGEVTDAKYSVKRDGTRQLQIKYIIEDADSEFFAKPVTQFFDLVDENLTLEQLEMLPTEEKAAINKSLAAIKRTLCGNPANPAQVGLGIDPNDLNDKSWDPAVLKGIKVNFAVGNWGPTNEGVQVRWVNKREA